jgi:hypothetical protein
MFHLEYYASVNSRPLPADRRRYRPITSALFWVHISSPCNIASL